jgi:glycosyltransferase involved in cell wall biosynthesis
MIVDEEMNTDLPAKVPISVLMACYNGARWLEAAINSILNQSHQDFEFIIVDDGSTDASAQIIASFAAKDSRIRVITRPQSGLSASLNAGIKAARGDWVARIDADDVSETTRLEKQYAYVCQHASVVFVGSALRLIDERGRILSTHVYPSDSARLENGLRVGKKFPPHSSAFFRRDIALSLGGYRGVLKRAEDHDLWLRLSEVGRLAALGEPLVQIRIHSNQMSHLEAGRRQLIDAKVAVTSYWLRRAGCGDPLANSAEMVEFYAWVSDQLQQTQLFEYVDTLRRLKLALSTDGPGRKGMMVCVRTLASHPGFVFEYLKRAVFSDNSCKHFASRWAATRRSSSAAR